jgi:signal transduction histidine kinase
MWILGAIVAGAGALEGLWRSNLTPTFGHLAEAGAIVLMLAFVGTAGAAAKAGSRLSLIGVPVFLVGWLTLFFGVGAILVLLGFALYALGVARSGVVERRALVLAVVLLLLALPVAIASDSSPVGIGLALVAACAAGVGAMAAGSRSSGATRSPGRDRSSTRLRSV